MEVLTARQRAVKVVRDGGGWVGVVKDGGVGSGGDGGSEMVVKWHVIQVGGLEEAYAAAKPLFLSMGQKAIYCGGAGNGSVAKICNNLAMAVSMLGVSEAFALGQSLGIAASTLTSMRASDAYNPVPGVMDGVPSSRNYDGGFSAKLMAKDINLAAASAEEVGLKSPLTSQTKEIPKYFWEERFDIHGSCGIGSPIGGDARFQVS
ncbi:hypothetical protein RJ640_013485 [Escallonia rubra]|uniref:3-hydroxyisobutyrate dehydrogenase-like NAD-binding domain-containing protein n=1 Tax=Escallonia rubra TaxID=112253 RepID=A0AA88UWT2_9ASTE|nr:hypothetical protein RJ640_013485 [Escallonia rubra]